MKLQQLLTENEFNEANTAAIKCAIKEAASAEGVNVSFVVFEPVYEGPYDKVEAAQALAVSVLRAEFPDLF